eukprot:g4783.t1
MFRNARTVIKRCAAQPRFGGKSKIQFPKTRARAFGGQAKKMTPIVAKATIGFGMGLGLVGAGLVMAQEEARADGGILDKISQPILWAAIRSDIEDIMDDENASNPGKDNFPGNSGGGGDIGPMFVRLAWHCSGTWCKGAKNGGSDGGTMRFKPECDHGGNAGLHHARNLLENVFEKYEFAGITHADLYVFAGSVAIEAMGGPSLPFRTGRTDAKGPASPSSDSRFSPDGRLPDADGRGKRPGDHVRDIFYRMGFNDQEIVALSGAHGLGRCHTDRSGFWGPWTRAPTTFSNEYFRVLEELKWSKKFEHNGKKWTGPEQYENEDGKDLMMLPTDIALVWDPAFRKYVQLYKDDETKFFADFAAAWTKLTELGCKGLGNVVPNLGEEAENAIKSLKEKIAAMPKKKKGGWFW